MFKIIEEPKNGQQWCDLANMHSSVYTSAVSYTNLTLPTKRIV